MEYTVTKNETSADLELVYNPSDIDSAFEKAYLTAAKKAKIDGFRPGKAPISIVKKVLGESVTQDALNILLSESINDLQSKLDVKTFGDPKIEIKTYERKEKLVATASFELAPEIIIGDYKNIPMKVYEIIPEDSDIEEHIKDIQFQLSKTSAKETGEKIEEGDLIDMNFEAKDLSTGDVVQKRDNYSHYTNRNPINKELEKHLVGLEAGQEKTFSFVYPEDTPDPQLVGKELEYNVKINEIFNVILPEPDDAFAREWNESINSLEELKNQLKDGVKNNLNQQLEQLYFSLFLENVIENSKHRIPQSMIEKEIEHSFHDSMHEMGLGHITMDKFAEILKKDISEVKKIYEERATRNIKNILAIYKIAEIEKIQVEQEELSSAFESYRQRTKVEKLAEKDINKIARNLHENILMSKVFRFLFDNSQKNIENIGVEKAKSILSNK